MHSPVSSFKTLSILAVTQILAWGALYYAFAIVALDIGRDLGLRREWVFGPFSWCLLVAGMASTPVGVLIDRHGGRVVMAAGSLVCGIGMILLSRATSLAAYIVAWTVLGLSMSAVLYEAAFATITHRFGTDSRRAISTLTLFAGFASTVFWPLTLKVSSLVGWRDTYLYYGLAQLLLCLPLHLLLGRHAPAPPAARTTLDFTLAQALRHPAFWTLAFAFATNAFIFSALSVHLIPILHGFGHPLTTVVFMAALIGPMQVLGRVVERMVEPRVSQQTVGKVCFSLLPGALLSLLFFGAQQWAMALFCVLYGLSNGIVTIVRGTIPNMLFGARNYGAISGAMSGPSMVAKAAGPLAIAAVIQSGSSTTMLFGMMFGISFASLLFFLLSIRAHTTPTATQTQADI